MNQSSLRYVLLFSLIGCAHISSVPVVAGPSEYYIKVTSGLIFKKSNILQCTEDATGNWSCYRILDDAEAGASLVSMQEKRVEACAEAAAQDADAEKDKGTSLEAAKAKVDAADQEACVELYNKAWSRANQ